MTWQDIAEEFGYKDINHWTPWPESTIIKNMAEEIENLRGSNKLAVEVLRGDGILAEKLNDSQRMHEYALCELNEWKEYAEKLREALKYQSFTIDVSDEDHKRAEKALEVLSLPVPGDTE